MQGKIREEENAKTKESKYSNRAEREEDPRVEEEPWYDTIETSHSYRPRVPRIRVRQSLFTTGMLEDPLPSQIKSVSYEYNDTTDPEDHASKCENIAFLYEYTEEGNCRVFSTMLVGAAQQWFKHLQPGSISSFEELYEASSRQFRLRKKVNKIIIIPHDSETVGQRIPAGVCSQVQHGSLRDTIGGR